MTALALLASFVATARASAQSLSQALKSSPAPTLQSMAQATLTQDYTATQRRIFRDDKGSVVVVREQVQVDANNSAIPTFQVTFLGVEGELPGSPLNQKWQQVYSRFGRQFFLQASFRVRDLTKVQQNYTLHSFGSVLRANRLAHRLVIFPQSNDKSIWVIDVDTATSVALYAAEFDASMRLQSEVETIAFQPSAQLPFTSPGGGSVTTHPDYASAQAAMGNPAGLIDPDTGSAAEYGVDRVEVRTDPLNGRQTLSIAYTDGVDEFVITQMPGSSDMFDGLPSQDKVISPGAHTIGRYRDPAMSVLMFWDDGVAFRVVGRGSLQRLDEVARRVYTQAITN